MSTERTYWGTLKDGTKICMHYKSLVEWANANDKAVSLGWSHRMTMDDGTQVAEGPTVSGFPPDGNPETLYCFLDGNSWCVCAGDAKDIPVSTYGFGDTPYKAVDDYKARRCVEAFRPLGEMGKKV